MIEIPRLPRAVARSIAEQIIAGDAPGLASLAAAEHPQAAYPEVLCGSPLKPNALMDLRDSLLGVAESLGFPGDPTTETSRQFDVQIAHELNARLPLAPRTAADPDVWNFICCVLLPDLCRWRFASTTDEKRFLGGPRNTLQRLWVRSAVLSGGETDSRELMTALPEDALVQIFERTAVWADWDIAREIAELLFGFLHKDSQDMRFEAFARRLLLEIRQLMPISSLSSIPQKSRSKLLASLVHRIESASQ